MPKRAWSRRRAGGAGLQEQLLVDMAGLALRRDREQLAGDGHQCARVALGVIGERGDQLRRHQLDGAGLLEAMQQQFLQLVRRSALQRQAHPHAAAERGKLLGAQALQQPTIAAEHDGQQDVAVEAGG